VKYARAWAYLLILWAAAAHAQWLELSYVDPRLRWRTLETEHFEVHFAEQHRNAARLAASVAESVYPRITAMLDWQPRRRTHLVILDSADFSNGLATPVPFNLAAIFLTPPDEGELLQNRGWLELVLTHELFHVVHLDKARGPALGPRDVLGRLPVFFPNLLEPGWVTEGLAVYAESDPAKGYGRLGQSTFEGMMRAEAARGFRPLSEVNAEGRGFPLNRDYLYGSYFFAFLRERYGEKAVRDYIENYSGNLVPFRVESNPKAVTGKPMDELWVDYQAWLRERFAPQTTGFAQGEVVAHAFSIQSPTLGPDGTRWYAQGDGYTHPWLVRQPPGAAPQRVRDVEEDSRLATAGDDVLVSELDICGNYNLLYYLYRVDAHGRRTALSRCTRDRLAAPLADGRIAALRLNDGAGEVALLDQNGRAVQSLYRAAPGESLSGLAAKGDTVVVTAVHDGRWSLLELKDGRSTVLVSDSAIKHSPRFGESPDEIYFIANYGGTYDVWSLNGTRLSRWTRSANGVREMSAPVQGEMLLVTFEAQGDALRLYRLPAEPLERREVTTEVISSPEKASAGLGTERAYSPWSSLRPTSWLPLIDIAEGAVALGFFTYGQDALGVHQYLVAPEIEITQGELLGHAEYVYDNRHAFVANRVLTARASTTGADSGSELRAYSIRENAQWTSLWRSLALNRRFYWGLGAAIEEETFHDLAAGFSTRPQNERVVGLVAGMDTRREWWLSEGPSEGQLARLYAETSHGLGATFPGSVLRGDWRGHLALGRTVLSLRWNEAAGENDAEPFQLGGTHSDDYTLFPILNEREFALRGYTSGHPELTGHRARIASTEWRVPLADVDRHLMVPPLGLNRLSATFFLDVGAAWEHGNGPDYHRGVGLEVIAEPRFGYLYAARVRAGVAKGLDATGTTQYYLQVGRSF
jgi:hypothetical protein